MKNVQCVNMSCGNADALSRIMICTLVLLLPSAVTIRPAGVRPGGETTVDTDFPTSVIERSAPDPQSEPHAFIASLYDPGVIMQQQQALFARQPCELAT
jgi:hypothetical protein